MRFEIRNRAVFVKITASERAKLSREGYIESSTPFVSNVLSCAVQTVPDEYGREITADFKYTVLTLYVSERLAKQWIDSGEDGIHTLMDVDDGERILLQLSLDNDVTEAPESEQQSQVENPLAYKHN